MVPRPFGDGRFEVDAGWGTVQPIEIASGVRTVGELELVHQLECGLAVIDTRRSHFYREATIPGATNVPHTDIDDRRRDLDRAAAIVLFCNGPQCKATPTVIRALLEHGHPAELLLYYRGGMHDWMTLGYPTVAGATR
jgi:rhodanese-related sulfurtransferase